MHPPKIQKGDKICMVAPAGKIAPQLSQQAAKNLRKKGFEVELFPTATGAFNYFSGTAGQRLNDLQTALDDEKCKVILCARGGYGTIHLMEHLNWEKFEKYPKWLVGFSDITMLHATINKMGISSIHAGMAKEFAENTAESLKTLGIMQYSPENISWNADNPAAGIATGKLVGGNLAILTSLAGTPYAPDYRNSILFIEDIGEYLYKTDRMLWTLKHAGILKQAKGLVLGYFNNMADTTTPYGATLEQLVTEMMREYRIPVAIGLKSGHDTPNLPLLLGANVQLEVTKTNATLTYLL